MNLSVYLPLVLCGLFGLTAPTLGRHLPPAAATWLLSVGGFLAAAGSVASLTLLGFTLVGQTPALAARGHWSGAALRHYDPVATPIAVVALVALVLLAARVVRAGLHRGAALRAAYRLAADLPGGELAVIDEPGHQAFAVPGRPGRIVVSSGLMRSLDAAERRAVLTHERSHLSHHHHVHHTLAHLAAATNPLLLRLPEAVALSTERWADEDAAGCCPRSTVAVALTRAAIGASRAATPAVVLAAVANHVAARVHALCAPAPRVTLWRVTLLVGLLAGTAAALLEAGQDTEQLFELAQFAYRAGGR